MGADNLLRRSTSILTQSRGEIGAANRPALGAVIQIKARRSSVQLFVPMKHTYELFLSGPDGKEWFVALTCEPSELLTLARRTIAEQRALEGEIRQFGRVLLTLDSEEPR